MFYSPDGGVTVIMQTASRDLPGPVFFPPQIYPSARTTYRYNATRCEHVYANRTLQLRAGDEGESLVRTCTKCGDVKVLL